MSEVKHEKQAAANNGGDSDRPRGKTSALKESLAVVSVVISLIAVPLLILLQEKNLAAATQGQGTRLITLTGMARDRAWTTDSINGANYWWKTFESSVLRVNKGELVTLRLRSADVHHRFYAPELGIGPIDVEPGHTVSVQFRPDKTGVFKYFCTSICGECHFYMNGLIVVTEKGQPSPSIENIDQAMYCEDDLNQPSKEDMVTWGKHLYRKNACITCHGENAKGGVKNFNYSKATIPGHVNLAENFNLEEQEDAEAFIELLKSRADLDEAESETDIPQFRLVLTKYNAAKDLIRKGKHGGKLDKDGLAPPLNMPSWQEILTDRDIDSIIAYLLSIYPWEDEEEFEDFEE